MKLGAGGGVQCGAEAPHLSLMSPEKTRLSCQLHLDKEKVKFCVVEAFSSGAVP